MNFQQRVNAFIQFGLKLSEIANDEALLNQANARNNWFTIENMRTALQAWSDQLTEIKVKKWLEAYQLAEKTPQKVTIIMAGNIPLVGLHDLLCVLATGNIANVKCSSDDQVLMKRAIEELGKLGFESFITISEDQIPKGFDKVIATGSNNTNRYFEYYFRNKPALLRKNRNSVAVLTGNETPEDYKKLGGDIFTYFGLGCRNVSKLFVPAGFDFTLFFESLEHYNILLDHHKYANNYTYHKAIFLMNMTKHLDNGFLLVKSDDRMASPLGALFYQEYDKLEDVQTLLKEKAEEVQCVVSKIQENGWLPLGKAQSPELWDYADGVDTIAFLCS